MLWKHPANRGLGKYRSMARAAAWQAYKRTAKSPWTISVYSGSKFRAYPDSTQPGRFLYFGGYPDFEEMTFMRRYLRPGDGFIDGGPNEGMFTLLAGELIGPTGAVHAFEAVPRLVERLRETVALTTLSQVTIHDVAIGERDGGASFVIRGTGSRMRTAHDAAVTKTITIAVERLDDALPPRDWAMAKLDLEGADEVALRGAEQLVTNNPPPVWMLEVVDRMHGYYGGSERQMHTWLQDHRYDLVLYRLDQNTFEAAPDPIWPLIDLMAVHREHRSHVEARLQNAIAESRPS